MSLSLAGPCREFCYDVLDASLKEIRILTVHAATRCPTELVRCTISHVSLLNKTRASYETVSYVWGDATARRQILVNGRLLDLAANTERAIRRFRQRDKDRTLWIDGACINQCDLAKRSQQIEVMADIYTMSTRNLILLGEDDGCAARAKDVINSIIWGAFSEAGSPEHVKRILTSSPTRFSPRGLSESIDLKPFLELSSQAWFSRLWVLQEAALAPRSTCYCGEVEFDLNAVATAAAWLKLKVLHLRQDLVYFPGIVNAGFIYETLHEVRKARSSGDAPTLFLANMLCAFGSFQASEPRDYVYAVLGMYKVLSGHDKVPRELVPDYTKSLSEVYRHATKYAIRETGNFDVFNVLHVRTTRVRGSTIESVEPPLPTWVPAWNRDRNDKSVAASLGSKYVAHGGRNVAKILPSLEDCTLVVRGFVYGTLARTSSLLSVEFAEDMLDKLNLLRNMLQSVSGVKRRTDSSIAMTLTAGVDAYQEHIDDAVALERFEAFVECMQREQEVPTLRRLVIKVSVEVDDTAPSLAIQASHVYRLS